MRAFLTFLIVTNLPIFAWAAHSRVNQFLKNNGYVEVPLIKNKVGHLELKMKINGVEGRFILDTGASATVLDAGSAKKFNLPNKIKEVQAGGLGKTNLKAQMKNIKRIQIGDLKIKNIEAAVLDFSDVNKQTIAQGAKPHDGVIGADILEKTSAIIDYSNKRLFLKVRQS